MQVFSHSLHNIIIIVVMFEITWRKLDFSISCSFPPKANGKADIQWANIVPALWWDV